MSEQNTQCYVYHCRVVAEQYRWGRAGTAFIPSVVCTIAGSWLGSTVGAGLGALVNCYFVFYLVGALTLFVTGAMLSIAPGTKVTKVRRALK